MKPEGLKLLIQAGNPIISIETPDEPRATEVVRATADSLALPVFEWTVTTGLREARPQPGKTVVESGKVPAALAYLKESAYPAVYLFKDLGAMCKDPQVVRWLRDLYFTPSSRLWTLVLIDALGLPPEVRRLTVPDGENNRGGRRGERERGRNVVPSVSPALPHSFSPPLPLSSSPPLHFTART